MNTELFIAQRILTDKSNRKSFSTAIIKVAMIGISVGLVVMILSIAIVTGFKKEVRNKVTGFGAHILITNHDSNSSYEMQPIAKAQTFYPSIENTEGIRHIQVFATKPGIVQTATDIQGVVIKGVGSDYDWSFFDQNIVAGRSFRVEDGKRTNEALISSYLARLLKINVGDTLATYFIYSSKQPRVRPFVVCGIYETSMEEFDQMWVIADIGHVQRLNEWTDEQVGGFEVLIDDFDQIDPMTDVVFDAAGSFFANDGSKLKVRNIKDLYPQIFDWLQLSDTNVWVILIIIIIVSTLNMVSSLLILILERTYMIGVLKALGYQNVKIQKLFLYIAASLLGRGVLWGNVAGITVCLLQQYLGIVKLDPSSYYVSTVPISINLWYVLLLNAGTMAITLTVLVIPSWLVARIKPIEAIRFN